MHNRPVLQQGGAGQTLPSTNLDLFESEAYETMMKFESNTTTLVPLNEAKHTYKLIDAGGRVWALKLNSPPVRPQHLFSEFMVAKLAREFGLRWPDAHVARFKRTDAVALDWLEGLKSPFGPIQTESQAKAGYDAQTDEEARAGAKELMALFMDPARLNAEVTENAERARDKLEPLLQAGGDNAGQLCGFDIFARWAWAADRKPDVLQVDASQRLWFLDGEHYLGLEVNKALGPMPSPADRASNEICMFGFLIGIRDRQPRALFEPWLEVLSSGRLEAVFEKALEQIPPDWLPNAAELEDIRSSLFRDGGVFVSTYPKALQA